MMEVYEFDYNGHFTEIGLPDDVCADDLIGMEADEDGYLPYSLSDYVRLYPHKDMNFYVNISSKRYPFFYVKRSVFFDVVIFFKTQLAMNEYQLKIGVSMICDNED